MANHWQLRGLSRLPRITASRSTDEWPEVSFGRARFSDTDRSLTNGLLAGCRERLEKGMQSASELIKWKRAIDQWSGAVCNARQSALS